MIDTNYFTIHKFMLNKLGLKGNELIIYALIYDFSQDGKSCCGLQYLTEWTNCTKQGVLKCLKSLLEKGLIKKVKKGAYCIYQD